MWGVGTMRVGRSQAAISSGLHFSKTLINNHFGGQGRYAVAACLLLGVLEEAQGCGIGRPTRRSIWAGEVSAPGAARNKANIRSLTVAARIQPNTAPFSRGSVARGSVAQARGLRYADRFVNMRRAPR